MSELVTDYEQHPELMRMLIEADEGIWGRPAMDDTTYDERGLLYLRQGQYALRVNGVGTVEGFHEPHGEVSALITGTPEDAIYMRAAADAPFQLTDPERIEKIAVEARQLKETLLQLHHVRLAKADLKKLPETLDRTYVYAGTRFWQEVETLESQLEDMIQALQEKIIEYANQLIGNGVEQVDNREIGSPVMKDIDLKNLLISVLESQTE